MSRNAGFNRRLAPVFIGLVAILALAFAGAAQAASLTGGTTTLKLDSATAKALKALNVAVSPIKPSKSKRSGLSFPITGATVDPLTGAGSIDHSGGIQLSAGKVKVPLKNFKVVVGSKSGVSAKLGRKTLPLAIANVSKAKVDNGGLKKLDVTGVTIALTKQAAKALNKAFKVKAFKAGLALGAVKIAGKGLVLDTKSGTSTLTLDLGTVGALGAGGISLAPIAPATSTTPPGLAFPVIGGTLDLSSNVAAINHSGGFSLTKGTQSANLTDPIVTIGASSSFGLTIAGLGSALPVGDLNLASATTTVAADGKSITIAGAKATLSALAAPALSSTFGVPLAVGTPLGTATVVVNIS